MELDLLTNLHATAATLGHWVPEYAHSDSKLSDGDGAALAAMGSACSAILRAAGVTFDGAGYTRGGGPVEDDVRARDIIEVRPPAAVFPLDVRACFFLC